MKNNTKVLFGICIIFLILSINKFSNAYSVGLELTANNKLISGEEILVTIKIKNLDVGSGIDAFIATLNYDTNIFETITNDDFITTNGWSPLYNSTSKIFTLINNSKISLESPICAIKFKVKNEINSVSTEIKLNNIMASGGAEIDGGTGDIEISDASLVVAKPSITPTLTVNKVYNATLNSVTVTVTSNTKMTNSKVAAGWTLSNDGLSYTRDFIQNVNYETTFDFEDGTSMQKTILITEIISDNQNTSNDNTNNVNNANNDNINIINNTNGSINNIKDNTTKPISSLPFTGGARNVIMLIIIIVLAIVAYISYKRYKNINYK